MRKRLSFTTTALALLGLFATQVQAAPTLTAAPSASIRMDGPGSAQELPPVCVPFGGTGGTQLCREPTYAGPPIPAGPSSGLPPLHDECEPSIVGEKCEEWVSRYDHPNGHARGGVDVVTSMAMSPDGRHLFVTGQSWDPDTGNRPVPGTENFYSTETHWDIATVALDASSGAIEWTRRYNGIDDLADIGRRIAMSADGIRVFVTGTTDYSSTYVFPGPRAGDVVTLCYEASTGELLWTNRSGTPYLRDTGLSIAVADGGGEDRVYVTGMGETSEEDVNRKDLLTLAYDAEDGELIWETSYDGPANGRDEGAAIAVTPDGRRVLVTGLSEGAPLGIDGLDYVTIAYDAGLSEDPESDGGAVVWEDRYDGPGAAHDRALGVVVAPTGSTAYVTGASSGDNHDIATIAYDVLDGGRRWIRRFIGEPETRDEGYALTVSPDGSRVFVVGTTVGNFLDYITLAYDAATGNPLWASKWTGVSPRGLDYPSAVAVSPDSRQVYVAGESTSFNQASCSPCTWIPTADSSTVAYDAEDGAELWVATHNTSPAGLDSYAEPWPPYSSPWASLAVAPDGSRVYLARTFAYQLPQGDVGLPPQGNYYDYGIVAYQT